MEQRAFLDEARALLTEGETALAIDLFTRAIANGESPVEARLERARAHLAMGQLPQQPGKGLVASSWRVYGRPAFRQRRMAAGEP